MYVLHDVYRRIESWDDVAPWLQRIEMFPEQQLRSIADENEIPCEWYGERDEAATLAGSPVGATRHCPQASRGFQNFTQEPFS